MKLVRLAAVIKVCEKAMAYRRRFI